MSINKKQINDKVEGDRPNPRLSANVFSRVLFSWLIPLFKHGKNHGLEASDLYPALPEYLSEDLGSSLERSWKKELINEKEKKKRASLFKAIFRVFRWNFFIHAIYVTVLNLGVRILLPLSFGSLLSYFSSRSKYSQLDGFFYASAIVLFSILNCLIGIWYNVDGKFVGLRVRIALSSLIYRKLLRLSSTSATKDNAGMAVNLLSNDVAKFDDVFYFFHAVWVVPIQVVIIAGISWEKVGLAGILGILITMLQIFPAEVFCGRIALRLRSKVAVRTDRRILLMSEIINGIRAIKMYSWEKPYERLVSAARRLELKTIRTASFLRGISFASSGLTKQTSLFFMILIRILMGKPITADVVFTMALYFNVLHLTLGLLVPKGISLTAEALASIKRIEKFLILDEIQSSNNTTINSNKENASIIISDLTAPVNSKFELRNISLTLSHNKLYAVTGQIGSGKSSLLKLILGELNGSSGKISISGSISYASQEPWLFNESIKNNILFGEPLDQSKYERVIYACSLINDFNMLPYGDKTLAGERGAALSGGQCARINLARAVYRDADIYLLDDPLSAVDAHVGKSIFEDCINSLLKDKVRILVTHHMQYLQKADTIIIINEGKIEFNGNFKTLQKERQTDILNFTSDNNQGKPDENQLEKDSEPVVANSTYENKVNEEPSEATELIAKGFMQMSVFSEYFRAGGSIACLIFVAFCYLSAQFIISACDYLVAYKTKLEEKLENNSSIKATTTDLTYTPSLFDLHIIHVYIGLMIAAVCMSMIKNILFYKICINASKTIYLKMLDRLLKAPMRFFNTNSSGKILNRFSKDTGAVDENLPITMVEAFQIFCFLVGAMIQVIIVNWWMSSFVFIVATVYWKIGSICLPISQNIKRLEGTLKSPVFSKFNTTFLGLHTIRSRHAEPMVTKQFDDCQNKHTTAAYLVIETVMALSMWLEFASIAFIASVTYSFVILNDATTFAGDVGLAVSQAFVLSAQLLWCMRQISETTALMTNVERMLQFTRIEQEGPFESDLGRKPPKSWPSEGCVKFEGVYLRYSDDDEPVLKNLNFSVEPKIKIGIVGRTGAGKSSLISALFQLAKIDGNLTIDNVDIRQIGLTDLRTKLSIIPQEPVLFPVSLRDNLDPYHECDDATLWSVLEEVDLRNQFVSLDQTISISSLSAGQRQLLCLSRAMLKMNKILVLDEATANVDPVTDDLIRAIVRRKFADCTVLTIAHRLNSIVDCDKVLVMDGGEVAEYDHPHVLLQRENSLFLNMVEQTEGSTAQQLKAIAANEYAKHQSR